MGTDPAPGDREALATELYEALCADSESDRYDAAYVGEYTDEGPFIGQVVIDGTVDLGVVADHLLAWWRLFPQGDDRREALAAVVRQAIWDTISDTQRNVEPEDFDIITDAIRARWRLVPVEQVDPLRM